VKRKREREGWVSVGERKRERQEIERKRRESRSDISDKSNLCNWEERDMSHLISKLNIFFKKKSYRLTLQT
jgi:hypothetical protein